MTAPSLSMWQMTALSVLATAAGDGECRRPERVQAGTLQSLLSFGLVAVREEKLPPVRGHGRRRPRVSTWWRVTPEGRAVLASANPAGAAAAVARKKDYLAVHRGQA